MNVAMTTPLGALVLALAGVVVLVHLLRSRRQRRVVSSLYLFRGRDRAVSGARPLTPPTRWLSLLVQLAAVVAVTLAAMGLTRRADRPPRGVMIVVDATASMAAKTSRGSTRFAEAIARARQEIEALPSGTPVGLCVLDRDARLASPMGAPRADTLRVLGGLAPTSTEGDIASAIALAVEQSDAEGDDVWIFGDTPLPEGSFRTFDFFEPAENAAITDVTATLEIAPAGPMRAHVDVQVIWSGSAQRAIAATLRQRNASDVLAEVKATLVPGTPSPLRLSFDVAPGDLGKGLVVDLRAGDALATDDLAFVMTPRATGPDVLFASRGAKAPASLVRAFSSSDGVRVAETTLEALVSNPKLAPETFVVVSGACPASLPGGSFLIVDPPEGACGGLILGGTRADAAIAWWALSDPRLAFLDLGNEILHDVRAVSGPDAAARAIAGGDMRGVLYDLSGAERSGTLLPFDVARQALPDRASFVVFVRNLIEAERRHATRVLSTHRPFSIRVPRMTGAVAVTTPPARTLPAEDGVARLDDVLSPGFVDVSFGEGQSLRTFAVNGASIRESDTFNRPRAAALPVAARANGRAWIVSLVPWLACAAILLLLIDAWLERERVRPGWITARLRGGAVPIVFAIATFLLAVVAARRAGDLGPFIVLHPGLLFVAPAAIAIYLGLRRPLEGPSRRVVSDLAHVVALGVLGTAAAGTVASAAASTTTIVVVDRSVSVTRDLSRASRTIRAVRDAARPQRDGEQAGLVGFAERAVIEEPVHGVDDAPPSRAVAFDGTQTDVEAGLRVALGAVAATDAARLVLVSDGGATAGDALSAARVAAARRIPVDVVALPFAAGPNIVVRGLAGPSTIALREPVQLSAFVASSDAAAATVVLTRAGLEIARTEVDLARGDNLVRFSDVAPKGGLVAYEVHVTPRDPASDVLHEDNVASRFVRVLAQRSALVVEGDAGQAKLVSAALTRAGFVVSVAEGAAARIDSDQLFGTDLLVLSDVPAKDFAPRTLTDIADYVRVLGGGMILLGGDRSLGPGGYGRTPIEDVAPVTFDARSHERRARLGEVIVIDSSGSMQSMAGGRTKLSLANDAAVRSSELLDGADELGVLHVDTLPSATIPLARIDATPDLAQRVRAATVGGGGILVVVGLTAAYEKLRATTTELKHVLLFADGSDAHDASDATSLVVAAKAAGITTSVVALGQGSDVPALERLSVVGDGRFHLIEDASRLPAVFAEETIQAARASLIEEPFVPVVRTPGDVLRGIDFDGAPALLGHVVVSARPGAEIALSGLDGDPILVTGRAGAGRTAVFTSDLKARWGKAWMRWPEASQMFAQLANAVARRTPEATSPMFLSFDGNDIVVDVDVEPGADDAPAERGPDLRVDVRSPDGETLSTGLVPSAAGRWGASLRALAPGDYFVAVTDAASGRQIALGGVTRGRATEVDAPRDGARLLRRIAEISGGRVLEAEDLDRAAASILPRASSGARAKIAAGSGVSPSPWLLFGGALAFVVGIVVRRVTLPSRAPRTAKQASSDAAPHLASLAERRKRRAPSSKDATAKDAPAKDAPAQTAPARSTTLPAPETAPPDASPTPPNAPPGAAPPAAGSSVASLAARKRARRGR